MGKKFYDVEGACKENPIYKKQLPKLSKLFSKSNNEKQTKPKPKTVPFYKLFRFCNSVDFTIIFIMILSSICVGVAFPLNVVIFRDVVNLMVQPLGPHSTYSDSMKGLIAKFALLSSGAFIAGFIQMVTISLTAVRQSRRYKTNYFNALLKQEISWFDKQQTGQLITKLSDDIESIEAGVSDKLAMFVQQISAFVGSMIVALVTGWKLSLIGCIAVPMMAIIFSLMIHFIKKYSIDQIKAYSLAGGIAEEILSSVRTVVAFSAQEKEVQRYSVNLKEAEKLGVKKALCQGIGNGSIGFTIYTVGSLMFYFGLRFVYDDSYDPGNVIQVFITIVIGSIGLGNAIPMLENFMMATASAYQLFEVIDRDPIISHKKPGMIPDSFCADISFKNVNFEYPTRPGVPILKNFNFTLPYGKTVAFIGPSGSGKSTIIHLLQRFYDPLSGEVLLGDTNLKDLDLTWYRSHIGVVQQEPPLFSASIQENIQLGKMNATNEEIIKSTKDSNAYEFIVKTKQKFETPLGDRGAGFSGGQKQRIAIATALVRDPHLLLLDEATSALDNISEKMVQKTLDKTIAEGKRTVVMVAHRLQTVRNADIIVVMKNGRIIEQGNHTELMNEKGLYWEMLEQQKNEKPATEEDPNVLNKQEALSPSEESKRRLSSSAQHDDIVELNKTSKLQVLKDFIRLMSISRMEGSFLIAGILASMFIGVVYPCSSILYSQLYQIFSYKYINPDLMMEKGKVFVGLFVIPAFCLLIGQTTKYWCLGRAGEALTTRLRTFMMKSILKQEMAWFDQPENLPGVLTARLALEASLVKGAVGNQLCVFIEAFVNLISSMVVGFYYSWELALLFFIFVPCITLSGIMQGKLSSGQRLSTSAAVSSSSLVLEVLNNIRTVNSLSLQDHFSEKYLQSLKITGNKTKAKLLLYGFISGVSASAIYYAYCVVFFVGSILLDKHRLSMLGLMRVFSCLTISTSALGRALSLALDTEKARKAARKTLSTIDRVTLIDADKGIIPEEKLTGNIEFKNIYFRYPTRMNVSVLKGLDLKINAGENVALVGHSGCGKSTLIQLLERYYDPLSSQTHGNSQILLDGNDLKTLNLSWVRRQLGLVKQEPSLFNLTIAENIVYGSDTAMDIDHMKAVAKMANIHDFIESLPNGYNTVVGQRGGHLSGGQKQRICIARALYNKPSVLLLDEATSALDTQSEVVVQDALNRAQVNSTSLVIAHRLSTIKHSDKIVVIEQGVVVECGTHEELMDLRGTYYELNMNNVN